MTEQDPNFSPQDRLHADAAARLARELAPAPLAESTLAPLQARLLQRVAASAEALPRRPELPWFTAFEGVQVQTLRCDPEAREQVTLWRLSPGARIPRHSHSAREECLVLEGAIVHAGQRHPAGDFLVAEAGSRHQPFDSPEGALLLIRGEPVPRLGRFSRWLLRRLRL
ncbi:MAG: cupin domain-containing protein [Aquimonas sp.]|nr:cupin domain-containing protein [Aquimonas sp.]